MPTTLLPPLHAYVAEIIDEAPLIPPARKDLLVKLSNYLKNGDKESKRLNFICTHNSRRSHLAQVWAAVATAYYGLDKIATFSGGTEATAFNPRAVAALERVGFRIENPGGDNPHYRLHYSEDASPLECWSKTFGDPANPERDFAAIMTCSDADENCPLIPGVNLRLSLTYEDPKASDDTPAETARYDERVRQIGREIFYAIRNARA